jgi:uncharacterized membrane protein
MNQVRLVKKMLKSKKTLFLVFSGIIGVVMLWRGIWGLIDIYLFPGHPELSNILSIGIGLLILLADDFELDELASHRATHSQETNNVSSPEQALAIE